MKKLFSSILMLAFAYTTSANVPVIKSDPKIEGYFEKPKSLMTLMTLTLMTGLMNTCTHIHQGEFARDE